MKLKLAVLVNLWWWLGDLNVEPSLIPITAKALHCNHLIDLDSAFSAG